MQILGLAQAGLKQFAVAETARHRSLELAPGDAAARVNLALAQLDGDHADAALQSLDQALALDPRLAAAHFNRSLALMKLGQPEAAITDFDRATQLPPERPDPR